MNGYTIALRGDNQMEVSCFIPDGSSAKTLQRSVLSLRRKLAKGMGEFPVIAVGRYEVRQSLIRMGVVDGCSCQATAAMALVKSLSVDQLAGFASAVSVHINKWGAVPDALDEHVRQNKEMFDTLEAAAILSRYQKKGNKKCPKQTR